MRTLRLFALDATDVPMSAAWNLADVGEAKGKQELFTRQSPQRLKALREHALVESAVSSNRIEGVEIDPSRVRPVVLGRPALRDRKEEEVRGYRDALRQIHESARTLVVSEETILDLHRLSRGQTGGAGQYRRKDLDIIILKTAYREFEDRLGQTSAPRGEKSEIVLNAIHRATGDFSVADLQRECPGVSLDMIRHVLKDLRRKKAVACLGQGRNATWRRRES